MQPLHTSQGYTAVAHDFSSTTSHGGSSSSRRNSNSLPGSWSEVHISADSGSKSKQSGQAQFVRGSVSESFLHSTSSATGLTKADAERISNVLKKRAAQLPGNSIHVLLTGNGSPYQNIQSRIMWVWCNGWVGREGWLAGQGGSNWQRH